MTRLAVQVLDEAVEGVVGGAQAARAVTIGARRRATLGAQLLLRLRLDGGTQARRQRVRFMTTTAAAADVTS